MPSHITLNGYRIKLRADVSDLVELQARDMHSDLPATVGKRGPIMYAPAGVHTIDCGLGGKASASVTIHMDESTAAVLQASFEKLQQLIAPQKMVYDFEHKHEEAMAWPERFWWANSPRPGVYSTVEYSSVGRDYVEGKVARAFSGSFYTD